MVFFCVLLFFILFPSFSQGAEPAPEPSLPPIVVTATRTEVPLNQLTTSLTVITSEEIRERQAETVSEVLRDVAGVNVIQTGSMHLFEHRAWSPIWLSPKNLPASVPNGNATAASILSLAN